MMQVSSEDYHETYYPEGVAAADEKRNGVIYCKGSLGLSGTGILSLSE